MAIRVVRLGSPRARGERLRIGTVRRPPRGVPKEERARRGYYDVWLPELAPDAELLAAVPDEWTDRAWRDFERAYRRQMRQPAAEHLIALLAALSHQTDVSVGCYCEDERFCHRGILRDLLEKAGAEIAHA